MAASITQIMSKLEATDRSALLNAFEEEITYYVEYTRGSWIGVNTDACPHLNCDQQAGDWRAGTILREEANGSHGQNNPG